MLPSLHFGTYIKEILFAPYTCALQQQYEFIHCGLSELVVCGETEIAAANLTTVIDNLKEMTDEGVTGFQKQLQVYILLHETCYVTFSFTRSLMK